jgi:hypothetical protein
MYLVNCTHVPIGVWNLCELGADALEGAVLGADDQLGIALEEVVAGEGAGVEIEGFWAVDGGALSRQGLVFGTCRELPQRDVRVALGFAVQRQRVRLVQNAAIPSQPRSASGLPTPLEDALDVLVQHEPVEHCP